jgi:hypothetical protein
LGDALSERDRDRIRMKALSREPLAVRLRLSYPLATGPEGVTLEGRKMAMAGTGGAVNERGSMPTLLNDTKSLGRDFSKMISGCLARSKTSQIKIPPNPPFANEGQGGISGSFAPQITLEMPTFFCRLPQYSVSLFTCHFDPSSTSGQTQGEIFFNLIRDFSVTSFLPNGTVIDATKYWISSYQSPCLWNRPPSGSGIFVSRTRPLPSQREEAKPR